MTTKDTYAVIKNPMRPFLQYEVWVSGDVKTWTGIQTITERATRKVRTFQSEQKATEAIQYWKDVASFKEQANAGNNILKVEKESG